MEKVKKLEEMDDNDRRFLRLAFGKRTAFLKATKGVSISVLTRYFNHQSKGIDYRGCTKNDLAESYVIGWDYNSGLSGISLEQLERDFQMCPYCHEKAAYLEQGVSFNSDRVCRFCDKKNKKTVHPSRC